MYDPAVPPGRRRFARGAGPMARPIDVLVVDDNRDVADSTAALLRCWGYTARVAYDGAKALELAQAAPPDCLFLDINMPGLDGYAVAGYVRADPRLRAAKLIAFSARGGPEYERRAAEAGFDYILTKPADPARLEEIFRMLENIVKLAEKTEDLARQNVELAGQTKKLLEEVKEDIREVKQDVKQLKKEIRPGNGGKGQII
jgi:two-component system OmpR family response regulator